MALQRFEKKQGTPKTSRNIYLLRGEVMKNFEGALLVKKANSNTTFFIDKSGIECDLSEGTVADFQIVINTYVGKGNYENLFRTTLRLDNFHSEDLAQIEEGNEFRGGKFRAIIKNVTITEMKGLYILDLMCITTGERIIARYYNPLDVPLADPNREISVIINLIKSKSMIGTDGSIFEDHEEKEIDGEKKTFIKYHTWVECDSIVG